MAVILMFRICFEKLSVGVSNLTLAGVNIA
jgi:hypothetical protein